jgi:alkanesulfonate monooxygenase SsuD/methylene tetrahydromethanopterin reductase-like flavin-dependent oxidoreductase (luciferase family)
MSALAAVTGRVRLGQMCTCMSYREPAYLAKVAATIDIIAEGRLDMGIGAGWYEHEWRAYGYGFPTAGERLRRLEEGVQIFRDLWTTGEATFSGRHYQVDGAICAPQPLQGTALPGSKANGIPMWIAGGGEKKTLRIAAQYADYTNFDGSLDGFKHKSRILREHCEAQGRDFGEIVRSANYNVVIGRDEREVKNRLAWIREQYLRAGLTEARADEQVRAAASGPAVGTPEQIVEKFRKLEAAGMTYAITYFAEAAYDNTAIQLFEQEVLPELVDREDHGHHFHLRRRH